MNSIIIKQLCKKIKKVEVLKNINYKFESEKIYGLYGRNGSGKTMLLRAIAGLIYPTSGSIEVQGKKLHEEVSFPKSIGVIIENTNLLPQYDAYTNLEILSRIKNVSGRKDIEYAIERVGLDPSSSVKVKKYSLGMQQRLSIAQAIFEKPDIILLDEPTNAIDENGIELVRNLLLEEKERGATIVVASHNKDDLNVLADHLIVMNNGEISHTNSNRVEDKLLS